MTKMISRDGPPKAIVLATDLSARCDRALDRAAALSQSWGAHLIAVHALESGNFVEVELESRLPSWRQRNPVAIIEAQLYRDLGARNARAIVERGEPAEIVLRVAEDHRAGLIVTGLARNEPLGRFGVGATVDRLARRASVPILIVKERPRRAYARILVASDFSESSKRALRTAAAFFPGVHLTILNAFDIPMSVTAAGEGAYRESFRAQALAQGEAFLASAGLSDDERGAASLIAEPGDPAEIARRYAEDHGADLVVVGTHGRPWLIDLLIGGTGRSILSAVPCDALLVPDGRETRGAETEG